MGEVSTGMMERVRKIAYLANGKMAEATNELALVQRIGGLLHTTNRDHFLVVFKQTIFRYVDVKGRGFGVKSSKRIFM